MKKADEIDELFKNGMKDPDIPFNDLDWIKMTDKLDAVKAQKGRLFKLYTWAGIAAVFIVGLFILFFNTNTSVVDLKNKGFKASSKGNTDKTQGPMHVGNRAKSNDLNEKIKLKSTGKTAKSLKNNPILNALRSKPAIAKEIIVVDYNAINTPMLKKSIPPITINGGIISSTENPATKFTATKINTNLAGISVQKDKAIVNRIPVNDPKPKEPGKLMLSILAAPDISNTRSGLGNKMSSNFGLLLSYPISKKLSISTGAIYAKKLYNYGGIASSLYGNPITSYEIYADCDVIDLPLNVNYKVLQKKKLSLSITSGLSSYFMLKEKYQYINVSPEGVQNTRTIEINNEYQHLFGVANFAISLDHQINERFSVGIQPFYKVPLTGIGLYNTNLKSKGVAVSISIKPFGHKK